MGLLSFIYGVDDAQAESDELDRKRMALNESQREKRGEEWFRQTQENDAKSVLNVDEELNDAFAEGFEEGVDNVRGTIGSILAFPFRLIPPIGWVLLIGAAFFYFGGGVLLRRKITKA